MSGTDAFRDADTDTLLNIENGVASFKASTDRYTANSNTVFIVPTLTTTATTTTTSPSTPA